MSCAKRRIAIKALAALLLSGTCALAWAAQVVGSVVNLSGPLMAKKADGAMRVLAVKSAVEQGDTLVSEKNTYAQIKFIDNSEMTLRPNTTFTIDQFDYDEAKPEADSASFNLVKGGLRSITGLLGKRNKEKFLLKTPTATIGIRGTTFIAQYVAPGTGPQVPGRGNTAPGSGALQPGLHVFVLDGLIFLKNQGGSTNFSAGQFGFTPNLMQTPQLVPNNSSLQLQFQLPPSFAMSSTNPQQTGAGAKAASVDCEVR